jgi:preprotein translocase subunit SecF
MQFMEFIKQDVNFNFVGVRRYAYAFSIALIAAGLLSIIAHKGINYGVDFRGGSVLIVTTPSGTGAGAVREVLAGIELGDATVQGYGGATDSDFRINLPLKTGGNTEQEELKNRVEQALEMKLGKGTDVVGNEMVGPGVGKDLREKALLSMFFALLFITVYISGRFELMWAPSLVMAIAVIGTAWVLHILGIPLAITMAVILAVTVFGFIFLRLRFAMGAIVALIHDVLITIGVFSIMGKEFNLPIVAAVLTIIGYSLNDTIIVFDRIRENTKKYNKLPLGDVINRSINETLSRTILTSGTTLVIITTLWVLGGAVIHDFAFALLVGIGIGTYSSVFVASPILLAFKARA